jgi:protein-export membrane protein SecD
MNTNDTRPIEPSDDEILAGVRRHLAGAEPLVPLPPAWGRSAVAGGAGRARVRTTVRSRVGFGGFAPLVMIAAVLVIVVGVGLGNRPWIGGGAGASASGPTGPTGYTVVYLLRPAASQAVTDAALDTTVQIMQRRLNSLGIVGATAEKRPPDEVAVHVPGVADMVTVRGTVGSTSQLAFVLLPAASYGDATSPGQVAIPPVGNRLDPALLATAEFTGADLDLNSVSASEDPGNPGLWQINFGFSSVKAAEFASWTGQHINEYFAIVLDGQVLSVPYIKTEITGGSGSITGDYTEADAKALASVLQGGTLPIPVAEVSFSEDGVTPAPLPSSPPSPESAASYNLPIVAPSITTPTDIPSSGRTIGNANAPVTVDIWVDYQCVTCREFATQTIQQLIEQYVRPGKARIVMHDMIVIDSNIGTHESEQAAEATRCAADQGKFWQYQDWLWANQYQEGSGAFNIDRLVVIAGNLGLDTQVFGQCLNNGTHAAEVQADTAGAGSAGIHGTPTVAVNGHPLATVDYATVSAALVAAKPSGSLPSSAPSVTPSPVASAG